MPILSDYEIDIAGSSEKHLPNAGTRPTQVSQTGTFYWLSHNRPENSLGLYGVTIASSSRTHNILISWKLVSWKLAMPRSFHFSVTVITICDPEFRAGPATIDTSNNQF